MRKICAKKENGNDKIEADEIIEGMWTMNEDERRFHERRLIQRSQISVTSSEKVYRIFDDFSNYRKPLYENKEKSPNVSSQPMSVGFSPKLWNPGQFPLSNTNSDFDAESDSVLDSMFLFTSVTSGMIGFKIALSASFRT
jgi:hypothetical protein